MATIAKYEKKINEECEKRITVPKTFIKKVKARVNEVVKPLSNSKKIVKLKLKDYKSNWIKKPRKKVLNQSSYLRLLCLTKG